MTETLTRKVPAIERKAFLPVETKVVDQEKGIVEALVAVTGNTDDGGDVIEPGAFEFKRQPKIVWSHDLGTLVAKVTGREELKPGDPRLPADLKAKNLGALKFTMAFDLEDDESRRAFRKVVFHDDLGWSIGYTVPAGGSKTVDGKRHLKRVEVWEASPVTFGMNTEARTLSAKSAAQRVVEELDLSDEQKATVEGLLALKDVPGDMEAKAWPPLLGSFEETSSRAQEAVARWAMDQFGERTEDSYWWASVEGTFDAQVVATVRAPDGTSSSYRFPYTADENGVVELGDPEPVTIRTTVTAGSSTTQENEMEITAEEKALLIEHLGEEKAGRVLSARNRDKIRSALSAIQEVLSAAGPDDEEEDDEEGSKGSVPEGMVTLSGADVVRMMSEVS